MIAVHIKPRTDNRFDIYIYDRAIDAELLVFSNQGYENAVAAERIARRLFLPGVHTGEAVCKPEPVELTITYRDGTTRCEMIR